MSEREMPMEKALMKRKWRILKDSLGFMRNFAIIIFPIPLF
jgi:hypothetical protein